ncbi:MAG: thiamine phosphate synthase [Thermodesulfobacteriota bacterium]
MTTSGIDAQEAIRGLYAIIDTSFCPLDRAGRAAEELLAAGVRIIQLRAKGAPSGEVLKAARAVAGLARGRGALFIINDRVDIALISGAGGGGGGGGVHLGQGDIPVEEARKLLGPKAVIGASTHDAAEAARAERAGADYLSFGPIFPTSTKADAHSPRGIEALREVKRVATRPIVAIGGITPENAGEVLAAGAAAVAMIGALFSSSDTGGLATSIVEKIGSGVSRTRD